MKREEPSDENEYGCKSIVKPEELHLSAFETGSCLLQHPMGDSMLHPPMLDCCPLFNKGCGEEVYEENKITCGSKYQVVRNCGHDSKLFFSRVCWYLRALANLGHSQSRYLLRNPKFLLLLQCHYISF